MSVSKNDSKKFNMPFFSIICVVKNNAVGLEKTLESIYMQNCEKKLFEVIIIDSVSTDSTEAIVLQYKPDIYISEPDKGIYDAMNKGILHSRGMWIYFLNGGDIFVTAHTLANLYAKYILCVHNRKNHSIMCAPVIESYKGNNIIRKTFSEKKMPFTMPTSHQGIFVQRDVMIQYMFDISYKICGDADLLARLFRDGHTIYFFDTPVAKIDGIGVSNIQWKLSLKECKKIQQIYYKSFLYTIKMFYYISQIYSRKILRLLMPEKMYIYLRKRIFSKEKKVV